ncbi:MAG TPA: rhodanese-like domain-containing protein [Candidatus Binatia bacterium]|jgi:rhodanese-related sulfurtransferase|nr:rhodanese-like domain-containing protein [Candidatus Binatia bacterium]
MTSISPHDLHRKLAAGERLHLLDVRTPREYAEVHVPGAVLEPLDSLDPCRLAQQLSPPAPLYVLCRSGSRARQAIGKLEKAGPRPCILVEGGTLSWVQAGLPVERQPVTGISLERQVRIAAGALVFLGTLLGTFFHRGFLALPAVVGGGLVFAGITDTCGLGMMLARMPWNRRAVPGTDNSCGCSTQLG